MASMQQPPMMPRGNTKMDSFKDEVDAAIHNNFIAGLKTEFTGLNFPDNSCTDASNCIFTMIGDITRRMGFDYEAHYAHTSMDRTNSAVTSYQWSNAGGDGETKIYVLQVGDTLYFYRSTNATVASPLSTTKLTSTVTLSNYLSNGSTADPSPIECQFADGNGYLFIYHPYCDPIYCTFTSTGTVTPFAIDLKVRDFTGITEASVPVTVRPSTLTPEHNYNIQNQGWTSAPLWTTTTNATNIYTVQYDPASAYIPEGFNTFVVPAGMPITTGTAVTITWSNGFLEYDTNGGSMENTGSSGTAYGNVYSYSGTSLVISVYSTTYTSASGDEFQHFTSASCTIAANNSINTINTWQTAMGSYPANADVWYSFKDSTGVFNPAVTSSMVPPPTSPAAPGHFLLDAFTQKRTGVSGIAGLTDVITLARPKTGAWFQGRVWYTGVDASQDATGDATYYTWTENIYFSQIITDQTQFGMCYQTNDPTNEDLFGILPSDGGIINIPGAGSIYKLYPIQNGMIVFAANGIWFITGSQGIGFTANDYTITKISSVRSISVNSFVDIQGVPLFWNEEGIYAVSPSQQGLGLTVNPLTVGTILTFYNNIPLDSKKYVKCAYNPITYVCQWMYRSTQETSVTDRYEYDSILCFNTHTTAFYPYNIPNGAPKLNGVMYVENPGGSDAPDSTFKYVTSVLDGSTYDFTFSEERDSTYVDWKSYDNVGVIFDSHFVTGYSIYGQAIRKFQAGYIYMYSRNAVNTGYSIQGIWDYSNSGRSGRQTGSQRTLITRPYHGMVRRRHKIRGQGEALQIKISSLDNYPFDIIGWAIWVTQNASV